VRKYVKDFTLIRDELSSLIMRKYVKDFTLIRDEVF